MKTLLMSLLGLALLQMPGLCAAADQAEPAAWKRQEIDLSYMGFTTRYSCDGLRDKLSLLLKASGVRPDFKVTSSGCPEGPGRVADFPRARLVFYAAVPAADAAHDAGEPTQAHWKHVTITSQSPMQLGLGDCELIEQFRDRVLPAMTTRQVRDDINCIPHQLSGSQFLLDFEVLQGASKEGPDQSAAGAR